MLDATTKTLAPRNVRRALLELGELDVIAADIAARPELRSWAWHYPKLAMALYPLACVAVLPVAPLIAGVANAPVLARWAGCVVPSGLVTVAMLLVLQLVITPPELRWSSPYRSVILRAS